MFCILPGFWLHIEGYLTPAWDEDGFVTGFDHDGTLGDELKMFLDAAAEANVFVIPVLWNGAYLTNGDVINLAWDDSKLTSYIENALKVYTTPSNICYWHNIGNTKSIK
jgi:mannan endo-1,4-beta-mannosidase